MDLGCSAQPCRYNDTPRVCHHTGYAGEIQENRSTLLPLSNRLQQELSRELHKRKYPQTMPGYALGNRIDTKHLYRLDQKIFTKNVPAKKGFDMAVAVLLDESGSMNRAGRYKYAQAAAIILQDFAIDCISL